MNGLASLISPMAGLAQGGGKAMPMLMGGGLLGASQGGGSLPMLMGGGLLGGDKDDLKAGYPMVGPLQQLLLSQRNGALSGL